METSRHPARSGCRAAKHLDCKDYKLTPAVAGIEDDPATTNGACVAATPIATTGNCAVSGNACSSET